MLNENAMSCWLGRDNVGYAMIEGNKMLVVLDMGTNVNMITPECVVALGLQVGPSAKITFTTGQLCCSTLTMNSIDGTLPLGLVVTGAYTVLRWGSKTIPVVLCNMMGLPIHLRKGQKVA